MQNLIICKTEYLVTSKFCTLSKIVEDGSVFNIPIYQRLYVWGDDQIKTLLEDLHNGLKEKNEHYYLGGVMVSLNHERKYDLIDGQQRFTTLWLIGNVIKNDLLLFNYLRESNKKTARLGFSIRDYANDFFNEPNDFKNKQNYTVDNLIELEPIEKAIQTIERFFNDNHFGENEKKEFSNFVFTKVLLMITEMPKNTDENKLFEVLNNRGVQLQHHEILKARMLKHITDNSEKSKYAKLWDACSLMDEYIEKNIKDVAGLKWKDLTFQPEETEKQTDLPADILQQINSIEEMDKVHLLSVLTGNNEKASLEGKEGKSEETLEYDSGNIDSIISFPMLLLHTLRIYQYDRNPALAVEDVAIVDEKKLLKIFDGCFSKYCPSDDKVNADLNVKGFFLLLWKIRIAFDKHIIKWIIKSNNLKIHGIKKLYLNKDALQRKESEKNDGFALLQSMLYHSQQIITHYWLTPLLNKLRSCDKVEELYKYLRQIDNAMFCAGNNQSLSERSWHLLSQDISVIKPDVAFLEIGQHKGTSYPSYVFYKLDFILWYLRDYVFEQTQLKETKKEDWENYRMTSKNSVEHISPQVKKETDFNLVWDEKDTEESKKNKLDDFGNLVLITSVMNSEYGNNIFTTKRSEFLAKANNKRLDSLKSALIFENPHWNWELCELHRNKMVQFYDKYFSEL